MKHQIRSYRDGYQNIEYCSVCGQESLALQNECVPIETQHRRIARLLNLHPDQPETWPIDILDSLIALEKAEGSERLYHKINQINGLSG